MNVLIIEDEQILAKALERELRPLLPNMNLSVTNSKAETIDFLNNNPEQDIIFSDIRLSDGLSFEIFDHVTTSASIIFTTAYNEYTIRAFDYNCIGYILKPVREEQLKKVLDKLSFYSNSQSRIVELKDGIKYRRKIILNKVRETAICNVDEIACFYTEYGSSKVYLRDGSWATTEDSLLKVMQSLDPNVFCRVNRKTIININYIDKILHPKVKEYKIILVPPYQNYRIKLSNSKNADLMRKIESMLE